MNPHLEKAIEQYGDDFQQLLTWHLCHGVVVCNADCFAMCYHGVCADLPAASLYEHSNTLFVTYAAGDMRRGLLPFCDRYDFIAFQRSFRKSPKADAIRVYPMAAFFEKLTT